LLIRILFYRKANSQDDFNIRDLYIELFENTNLSVEYRKEFNQKVLLSSQENVNLIHEILRQAFYLNLQDSTVKQCLEMYKKWFLRETSLPYFINDQKQVTIKNIKDESSSSSLIKDTDIKIGFIRSLQMFFLDSSILFFNRFNLQRDRIIDTCVCLLDSIKLFIYKVQMDQSTW
jgi:hypothetical protein